MQPIQRPLQQPVRNHRIPPSRNDGKPHPDGAQIALNRRRLAVQRVLRLPESQLHLLRLAGRERNSKQPRVPMRQLRRREPRCDIFTPVVAQQHPLLHRGVDGIKIGDLNQDRRHGRRPARDELQIAHRGEQSAAAALTILPALALLEAQREQKAVELVERIARGNPADQRNSLNHKFDCIVWSCDQTRKKPEEDTMSYETLLCEVKDQVATVTLNRPKVLHALNSQVFDELESVFRTLAADPAVRVILLTGSGEKAFAAGADINEIAATDATTGQAKARRGQSVFALVNGFALGGGCELAMACTIRIASETARLGQPEVKLGLIPGYGGTQRLPRLVGAPAALKLLLTGEMIPAAEALRIGLVDEVVPADQLIPRGEALAKAIVAMAPLAVEGCIEAVQRGTALDLEAALKIEAEIFGRLCGSADKTEGTSAFLEKRPPVWIGR